MSRPHAEDPHFPTPTRPAGAPVNRATHPAAAIRYDADESKTPVTMPDHPRWHPQTADGQEPTLEEVVFQALGRASTCWESMSGTGVFDSTTAKAVGDYVIGYVRSNYDPVTQGGPTTAELNEAYRARDLAEDELRGRSLRMDLTMSLLGTRHRIEPVDIPALADELAAYIETGELR